MKKHWIANNLFGLAFAVNGVELLHLNNVLTGCILLGGLFLYDIFWVFGTDVMVTVAKSFEAPIKLVMPQDLLENGFNATNMAMLGLGDIVIPGIFVALLLRYDQSLKRNSNFYFNITFLAYIAGLLTTIAVMHFYKHAQPALLYLVPACIGTPLFFALIRGDIKSMFQYADHPEDEEEKDTKKDD
jgi:minor histocompatibility antigen H13